MKNTEVKIAFHIIIFCFLNFLLNSCSEKRSDYFIKIDYLNQNTKIEKDLRNGFVALDFKDYFSNDSLKIKVDEIDFLNTVISTSEVSGGAILVEIDSLKNLDEISIQLNSGSVAKLKVNKDNQLFTVRYQNDTLKIKSVTFFIANR